MSQTSVRGSPSKRGNEKGGTHSPFQEHSPYKSNSVADAHAVHYTPEQHIGKPRSFGSSQASHKPGQGPATGSLSNPSSRMDSTRANTFYSSGSSISAKSSNLSEKLRLLKSNQRLKSGGPPVSTLSDVEALQITPSKAPGIGSSASSQPEAFMQKESISRNDSASASFSANNAKRAQNASYQGQLPPSDYPERPPANIQFQNMGASSKVTYKRNAPVKATERIGMPGMSPKSSLLVSGSSAGVSQSTVIEEEEEEGVNNSASAAGARKGRSPASLSRRKAIPKPEAAGKGSTGANRASSVEVIERSGGVGGVMNVEAEWRKVALDIKSGEWERQFEACNNIKRLSSTAP